jgi:hypothetical protein
MANLLNILRTLFVRGPMAVILGLVQLLFLLLLGVPALIVRLFEWLREFVRRMNLKEETEEDKCNRPLPEEVTRRPDPCIYSQQYLASQGVAVTWNNPDIWMAKASAPNVVEPDSYHLDADTDYIVSVRCHNASTDLATGVKVRLLYRPWSFNSPDLLPVDTTADGQEVVRFANIPGMGAAVVHFNWHTPTAPPGESRHFCLQAHLSHPMDINLENNMGQENTNVHSANPGHVAAGEIVDVDVPLFNNGRLQGQFAFRADAYAVDTSAQVQLELRVNTGREPWPLSKRLGSLVPRLRFADRSPPERKPGSSGRLRSRAASAPDSGRFTFGRRPRRTVTRARYAGHEEYKRSLRGQDFPLPAGMHFETPGLDTALELAPGADRNVPVRLQVPADAADETEYAINVRAEDQKGRLVGGVTFLLHVRNP